MKKRLNAAIWSGLKTHPLTVGRFYPDIKLHIKNTMTDDEALLLNADELLQDLGWKREGEWRKTETCMTLGNRYYATCVPSRT